MRAKKPKGKGKGKGKGNQTKSAQQLMRLRKWFLRNIPVRHLEKYQCFSNLPFIKGICVCFLRLALPAEMSEALLGDEFDQCVADLEEKAFGYSK